MNSVDHSQGKANPPGFGDDEEFWPGDRDVEQADVRDVLKWIVRRLRPSASTPAIPFAAVAARAASIRAARETRRKIIDENMPEIFRAAWAWTLDPKNDLHDGDKRSPARLENVLVRVNCIDGVDANDHSAVEITCEDAGGTIHETASGLLIVFTLTDKFGQRLELGREDFTIGSGEIPF